MTLNEMKDAIIRTYGFEHDATIYFFTECERTNDMTILEIAFEFAINWKDEDEE